MAGHLFSLILITVTSFVVGRRLTNRFEYTNAVEEIALSTALGFGVTGSLLFILGLLHMLHRPTVLVLILALHLVSLRVWRESLRRLQITIGSARARLTKPLTIVIPVLIAPMLLLALYPPTHFDATMYHLPFAKAFVESGAVPFLETFRFPVFPQLQEMLFVLGFFLTGEVAAQMSQFLALVLTAAVLVAWGTSLAGRRIGWWSAALWLGNPLAVWLGGSAMIDIGLTLFVTAGLFAWHRWLLGAPRRWLVLAAALIAFACASKYLGLFFFAAIALATAFVGFRRGDRPSILLFPSVILAIAGPWYARIIYYTGNPVFPYYSKIFGSSEWSDQLATTPVEAGSLPAALVHQLAALVSNLDFLILVPYNAVFARQVFNLQAPISPWYLVLIPVLAVPVLGNRTGRWIVVLALSYGLFWLTTIRDIRFLLPIVPIVGLALSLGADSLIGDRFHGFRWRHSFVVAVACIFIAPGWLYGWFKAGQLGTPPVTSAARSHFLSRHITGFDALQMLNKSEGSSYTVYGLRAENLRYYAAGTFLGDHFGPYRYAEMVGHLSDPQGLSEWLRSLEIDYLLILTRGPPIVLRDHASFPRFFRVVSETPDSIVLEPHRLTKPKDPGDKPAS